MYTANSHPRRPMNAATAAAIASILGNLTLWVILFALGFVLVNYGAFVMREMWDWFVVPSGYQPLTKTFSIGVMLIANLLKLGTKTDLSDKGPEDASTALRGVGFACGMLVAITLAWGGAAIWKFWLL